MGVSGRTHKTSLTHKERKLANKEKETGILMVVTRRRVRIPENSKPTMR